MAVDIYFKMEEYPYFDSTQIEVIDNIELFLQNVEMILTTEKGSVLGDPEFGSDLEKYLWSFNDNSGSIKNDIYEQIQKYVDYTLCERIPYEINVNFLKGEIWDTIIVDLIIDGRKVSGYAITP